MAGKRAARPPRKNRALRVGIAAAVALFLVVLVGWGAFAVLGGDDDTAGTTTGQQSTDAASADSSSPSPSAESSPGASPTTGPSGGTAQEPAALRACAKEVAGAGKVVAAAQQGVAHWRTHVQARTDMLDGRMSVSEMDAMWKRTRLAGPADQRRFKAALDSYDSSPACRDLGDVPAADKSTAADCATRYKAGKAAMAAAEAAMADWKSHLGNMAAYAAGKMSREEAQTKWVEAWRNAPPNIKAYEKARTALDDAPSCPAA
jgi:hypothetical protein